MTKIPEAVGPTLAVVKMALGALAEVERLYWQSVGLVSKVLQLTPC